MMNPQGSGPVPSTLDYFGSVGIRATVDLNAMPGEQSGKLLVPSWAFSFMWAATNRVATDL